MAKRLPRQIKVGYASYTIKGMSKKDQAEFHGLCDPNTHNIFLNAKSPDRLRAETLLHETLHAIHAEWKIGLPDDKEEEVVSKFSVGLAAVIRDNPGFIETLSGRIYGTDSHANTKPRRPTGGKRARKRARRL